MTTQDMLHALQNAQGVAQNSQLSGMGNVFTQPYPNVGGNYGGLSPAPQSYGGLLGGLVPYAEPGLTPRPAVEHPSVDIRTDKTAQSIKLSLVRSDAWRNEQAIRLGRDVSQFLIVDVTIADLSESSRRILLRQGRPGKFPVGVGEIEGELIEYDGAQPAPAELDDLIAVCAVRGRLNGANKAEAANAATSAFMAQQQAFTTAFNKALGQAAMSTAAPPVAGATVPPRSVKQQLKNLLRGRP